MKQEIVRSVRFLSCFDLSVGTNTRHVIGEFLRNWHTSESGPEVETAFMSDILSRTYPDIVSSCQQCTITITNNGGTETKQQGMKRLSIHVYKPVIPVLQLQRHACCGMWWIQPATDTNTSISPIRELIHADNRYSITSLRHKIQPSYTQPVLFCSLAFLDPRVGHTMDVFSPFISILCHSDWLFHMESCPRLDVCPGCAWSSSPACTWHCNWHYFFLQAIPLFPHGVTIVC